MNQTTHAGRIASIDQIRGAAVLFICLSHFAAALHGFPVFTHLGVTIGFVASPILVAISAFLSNPSRAVADADAESSRRWRLVDRGLFFLTIGHALDCLSLYGWGWSGGWLNRVELTDSIGLGLLLQGILPNSAKMKWAGGALGFAVYIGLRCLWGDRTDGAGIPTLLMLGGRGVVASGFPVLPWISFFLLCAAVGPQAIALLQRAPSDERGAVRRVIRVAGGLFVGAVVAVSMYVALRQQVSPDGKKVLYMLLHPTMKMPPSFGYYFFWLGAGTVLTALTLLLQSNDAWQRRCSPMLRALGRHSFVMLMLGWVLYEQVLWRLAPTNTVALALYFIASVGALWCAAVALERTVQHRWMTVGLAKLTARRSLRGRIARA